MALTQDIGLIADLIAILGIPWAGYQIYTGRKEAKEINEKREKEEQRKNDEISILLEETGGKERKIILANKVRRDILTRGEVLGRLGTIPIKPTVSGQTPQQNRFQIHYTSSAEFIEAVDKLYVSTKVQFTILCKTQEIDQFDVGEMKKRGFDLRGFA